MKLLEIKGEFKTNVKPWRHEGLKLVNSTFSFTENELLSFKQKQKSPTPDNWPIKAMIKSVKLQVLKSDARHSV